MLKFNLHGRLEDRNQPAWTRAGGTYRAAWELLQRGKPNEPAFWPNGQPGPAQENGVNPVVSNETGFDNTKTYYFQSSLSLGIDIPQVQGWSVEGTVAYDRTFEDYRRWQQPWTLYNCSADCSGPDDLVGTSEGVPEPRSDRGRFFCRRHLAACNHALRAEPGYRPYGELAAGYGVPVNLIMLPCVFSAVSS